METMHAAGRRTLPPVPRTRTAPAKPVAGETDPEAGRQETESPTERFVVDLATGEQHTVTTTDVAPGTDDAETADETGARDDLVDAAADGADDDATDDDGTEDDATEDDATEDAGPIAPEESTEPDDADLDPAQHFVTRLRGAAEEFAAAAGAESAVVPEAVPPARHRRARCRLVLRYADESQVDVTFLGPAGLPEAPARHGFDRQIRRWLAAGQRREGSWVVADPEAPDGMAVDLSAWIAAA